MATVSSGIFGGANVLKLIALPKEEIRAEISHFLTQGETYVQSFMTMRDQMIFTNKRIIVVNVQGITGKKVSYLSYPYAKIQYFGVETAGFWDLDSELILAFNDGNRLQFDFEPRVDIQEICRMISNYIL